VLERGIYDPTTGTFFTRDPLDGTAGTTTYANPYHYTDNDPANRTDPTGESPDDAGFGLPLPLSQSQTPGSPSCPAGKEPQPTPGSPGTGSSSGSLQCQEPLAPVDFPDPTGILEAQARVLALAAWIGSGSPSPVADAVGTGIAAAQVGRGASIWPCREHEPNGPLALSWRFRLVVLCVGPAVMPSPTADAFTMGHWVFCRLAEHCKMGNSRKALEHEYWHVDQFEQFGDTFMELYALEPARLKGMGKDESGCENRYERPAYQNNEGRCR